MNLTSLTTLFRPAQAIPDQYRANFDHLYRDMAWFGLLSGSSMTYVAIYATRLGASGQEIGLIGAAPAIINLIFALPVGRWLQGRHLSRTVFFASIFYRLFYLPWVLLPWLLAPHGQIWAIILTTLVMSLPGTVLAVGFNALFAETVPPEWRGHVMGVRNALFSVMTILAAIGCGFILTRVPFPHGYQIVFGLGFFGAMMSSYHLWRLRLDPAASDPPDEAAAIGGVVAPGTLRITAEGLRAGLELRFLRRFFDARMVRFEILRGDFGRVVAVLFFFHLSQYLAIPIFPIFLVNELHFSDQIISLGNAAFYVMVFLGSTQLARLSSRRGNQWVTGVGVVILGAYPILLTLSQSLWMYMVTSLVGGVAWSLAGGALYNYLLDRVPPEDRPPHLAWYNLALNAAILIGSLGGPLLAGAIGLAPALLLFGALRVLAGVTLLRRG